MTQKMLPSLHHPSKNGIIQPSNMGQVQSRTSSSLVVSSWHQHNSQFSWTDCAISRHIPTCFTITITTVISTNGLLSHLMIKEIFLVCAQNRFPIFNWQLRLPATVESNSGMVSSSATTYTRPLHLLYLGLAGFHCNFCGKRDLCPVPNTWQRAVIYHYTV